jgi:hypothetical protein
VALAAIACRPRDPTPGRCHRIAAAPGLRRAPRHRRGRRAASGHPWTRPEGTVTDKHRHRPAQSPRRAVRFGLTGGPAGTIRSSAVGPDTYRGDEIPPQLPGRLQKNE